MRVVPALVLTALALAAACGGEGVGEIDRPPTDTEEAARELARQADRAERVVEEEVRGLRDVRSLDELSTRTEDAQERLLAVADDLAQTQVPDELEEERQRLEAGIRDVVTELEDVKGEVDDDDLRGALSELRDLESVEELERRIERVRQQAPG